MLKFEKIIQNISFKRYCFKIRLINNALRFVRQITRFYIRVGYVLCITLRCDGVTLNPEFWQRLILTCNSQTSRNFTLGVKLGRGMNINEATNGLTSIAEGMFSTKAVVKLAKIHNVIMPITDSISKLIGNESDIDTIIEELLSRPLKEES